MEGRKPRRLFALLVWLLISVHFLSFSVFASDIIHLYKVLVPTMMIGVWVLSQLLKRRRGRLALRPVAPIIVFWLYLLVVAIVVSLFNTRDFASALEASLSYLILFFAAFVVVPNVVHSRDEYVANITLVSRVFLMAMLLSLALSFLNPYGAYTAFSNRVRYRGIFENANSLGLFSLMGLVLSGMLYLLVGKRRFVIAGLFYAALIIASDSRTALLAGITFVIILTTYWRFLNGSVAERSLFRLLFLTIVAMIMVGGLLFFADMHNFSLAQLDMVLSYRITEMTYALENYSGLDVLFGKGLGSRRVNPHNALIGTVVELGILGLLPMLGLLVTVGIWIVTRIKTTTNVFIKKVYLANFGLLAAFAVYGLGESVLINLGNIWSVFVWFSLGAVVGLDDNVDMTTVSRVNAPKLHAAFYQEAEH